MCLLILFLLKEPVLTFLFLLFPISIFCVQRTFVLSETFFESQTGVLLAPFYADLLDRQQHAGSDLQPLRSNSILAALQSELYCDSLAYKTLAVAQCVSSAANLLSDRLGVQSQEALHMHTTTAAFAVDLGHVPAAVRGGTDQEEEEVPLLGQESFEPHSGFCDKSLNQIQADFVLAAAPAVRPVPQSTTRATAGTAAAAKPADERSPAWVLPDGSTNGPVLRALCSKVLAVLSDKPAASVGVLHAALVVLSEAHTRALLLLMEEKGLVRSRSCVVSVAGGNGSADLFGFGAAVFARNCPAVVQNTAENLCYFARNIICPL